MKGIVLVFVLVATCFISAFGGEDVVDLSPEAIKKMPIKKLRTMVRESGRSETEKRKTCFIADLDLVLRTCSLFLFL